jgi:hypothetical protein
MGVYGRQQIDGFEKMMMILDYSGTLDRRHNFSQGEQGVPKAGHDLSPS